MITRGDIINVLQQNKDKTQEERHQAVVDYVTANSPMQADRDKIMADIESYEGY